MAQKHSNIRFLELHINDVIGRAPAGAGSAAATMMYPHHQHIQQQQQTEANAAAAEAAVRAAGGNAIMGQSPGDRWTLQPSAAALNAFQLGHSGPAMDASFLLNANGGHLIESPHMFATLDQGALELVGAPWYALSAGVAVPASARVPGDPAAAAAGLGLSFVSPAHQHGIMTTSAPWQTLLPAGAAVDASNSMGTSPQHSALLRKRKLNPGGYPYHQPSFQMAFAPAQTPPSTDPAAAAAFFLAAGTSSTSDLSSVMHGSAYPTLTGAEFLKRKRQY